MARNGKLQMVSDQFLERVKPEMERWGLQPHPSLRAYFGRSQHGYRYDFADLTDDSEIKLAAFTILQPNASLWITGRRLKASCMSGNEIPIIFGGDTGVFRLTPNWSILKPFKFSFELNFRNGDSNIELAASRLIDTVWVKIDELRGHLYN